MGDQEDRFFVPGCKAGQKDERGVFPCYPKIIEGGVTRKATPTDNPVLLRIVDGQPVIEDTGGADADLVRELVQHVKENL